MSAKSGTRRAAIKLSAPIQNKDPKPYPDTFIEDCVIAIHWAIEAGHEHWANRYTVNLVKAVRQKEAMKPKLRLVESKPLTLF